VWCGGGSGSGGSSSIVVPLSAPNPNPNHPLNPSKKTNSHGSQWANKLASFPKVPVAFSA